MSSSNEPVMLTPSLRLEAPTARLLRRGAAEALLRLRRGEAPCDLLSGGEAGAWRGVVVGESVEALEAPLLALAQGRPHPQVVLAQPKRAPTVGFLAAGLGHERADAGAGLVGVDAAFTDEVAARLTAFGRPELSPLRASLTLWQEHRTGKVLLGALGFGLAAALAERGVRAAAVCGYSMGEYVVAGVAGVYTRDEVMHLLDAAGASQAAHEVPGGMLLVRGPLGPVEQVIDGLPEVWLAAVNAVERSVVSGSLQGLAVAARALESAGLSVHRLPVTSPIHCPLMAPVAHDIDAAAPDPSPPRCAWISTYTGARVELPSPGHWGGLVLLPARFLSAWEVCRAMPVDLWVELGPTPALSLVARSDAPALSALDPALPDAVAFTRLLGWLWCHGVPVFEPEGRAACPPPLPVSEAEVRALLSALPAGARPDDPEQGAADLGRDPSGAGSVAAQDAREAALRALWSELLGLDDVSVHSDFFDVGGDSLRMSQVAARIATTFKVEVPLGELFEATTVAAQAALVARLSHPDAAADARDAGGRSAPGAGLPPPPPLAPAPRLGWAPTTFAQERYWRMYKAFPESVLGHCVVWSWLPPALDVAALRRAFTLLIERHEALRTVFAERDEGLMQRVVPPPTEVLEDIQLTGAPSVDVQGLLLRRLSAERQRRFDLEAGRPLRCLVVRLPGGERVLALNAHHIQFDAWSQSVLSRELAELLRALAVGATPELPPLPIQYTDYAAWQRAWLQGGALEALLADWREALSGCSPIVLPTDHPRPSTLSGRAGVVRVSLDPATRRAVQRAAGAHQASAYMVMLAAFQVLISARSGLSAFATSSTVSVRTDLRTEGLIGNFTNQMAVVADLTGAPSFEMLIARVRRSTFWALERRHAHHAWVAAEAWGERDLARSRLSNVMFNLLDIPKQAGPGEGDAMDFQFLNDLIKLDLVARFVMDSGELRGVFRYREELFERSTVEQLVGDYRAILVACLEDPKRPLSALPLGLRPRSDAAPTPPQGGAPPSLEEG